ncbi:aminodeoxychorismate lyase [Motilimonas cestriensis]|uniref:Aminodeoxychorismate lyase n=1 Tax=Motilimonas cestriensis TaxID=2742685 RepID=A0ABS8WD29_9GAMM|nr:aminodeoxychorismate lyase [Motilimonas cestriensis]MCE2595250.1 aminodeoxychorismate lyase [Motilimonas cestriensis]
MMLINGEPNRQISPADRGLAYGDGFFTTAKVVRGKVEFWRDHVERLMLASKKFAIELPSLLTLFSEVQTAIAGVELGCLKILITRGEGGRGYSGAGCENPTRIISVTPWPAQYQLWQRSGIALAPCQYQLGLNPQLAGYKTLNRLDQVLIKQELESLDVDDVIVCDINGYVVESSAANVFWFEQGTLYTPDLSQAGVNGVMRKQVLRCAEQLEIPVNIVKFKLDQLAQVDSMFITNTLMGLVPIKQFQQRVLTDFSLVQRLQQEIKDD